MALFQARSSKSLNYFLVQIRVVLIISLQLVSFLSRRSSYQKNSRDEQQLLPSDFVKEKIARTIPVLWKENSPRLPKFIEFFLLSFVGQRLFHQAFLATPSAIIYRRFCP